MGIANRWPGATWWMASRRLCVSGTGEPSDPFLDGAQVAEQVISGDLSPITPNGFTVGTWFQQNQAFAGLLDELRLYDVGIQTDLVLEHAQAP